MKPILVSGEITVETTLRVESFPLDYQPVSFPFFQMASTVAGVGVNQGLAHKALGRPARLLGLIAEDARGTMIRQGLEAQGLDPSGLRARLRESTQSLILYEPSGRRMIFNDLKDTQEAAYPEADFDRALDGCAAAMLGNLNFNRPFLARARAAGVPVITDVHVLSDPDDPYNRDFLAGADLLFVSNEHFAGRETEFAAELLARSPCRLLVIGAGAAGAWVYDRAADQWHHSPARSLRPLVNTVGAGDALSAAFTDGWLRGLSPAAALDRACVFAGWKVGAAGAAEGFLTLAELEARWGEGRD